MTGPRLTILTPTQGRATLWRLLDRGRLQLDAADEWLVIADTFQYDRRALADLTARLADYGPEVRLLAHDAGRHSYGHDQLNYGIRRASGDYLVCIDDDDVFTPGALAAIRQAAAALPAPQPLLFRFQTFWGEVLWQPAEPPELRLCVGHIGGHCLVAPNVPGKLGRWTTEYEGDHTWIIQTLRKWQGQCTWVDRVIAQCRPPA